MVRSTDTRLLWKFAYNFGYKGMRSVQRFKKRLKEGNMEFYAWLSDHAGLTNDCLSRDSLQNFIWLAQ